MAERSPADEFNTALGQALRSAVERVLSEEAEAAAQRCRERVQREVGTIATGLLSSYRCYLGGRDELHIIVKIEQPGGRA